MDQLENLEDFFVLLFWFVNERNWTVQGTSTIVKPRNEGYDYKPGDIVVARFYGKIYRAVVISVKDEKDKLQADTVQFDKLLRDDNLSPNDILIKMGINSDLGSGLDNLPTNTSENPKETHKNPGTGTKRASKSKGTPKPPKRARQDPDQHATKSPAAQLKASDKHRKAASLESSKCMAARLLQNMVSETDMTEPSVSQSSSLMLLNLTPEEDRIVQPRHTSEQACHKPASPKVPATTQSNIHQSITPVTTTATSSQLTHGQVSNISKQQTYPLHQNFQSEFEALPLSSNHSTSFYSNTNNTAYDWDVYGNGSVSKYLANSFTNDTPTATMDCYKCMGHIHTLQQKVKLLEEQVNTLMSARSTPHLIPQFITHQPDTPAYPDPEPCAEPMPVCQGSATSSGDTQSQNSNHEVELVPGYGVKISVPQLDACLRKAKSSGTALSRLLCSVFFSDETLSASSARGTKLRPALDKKIVDAIIRYVEQKRKVSEKDVVQAINKNALIQEIL